jgi:kynurenine formamidase
MAIDRSSYEYWQYNIDWRTVPSPKYGPGIVRVVDLSHGLHDFPGPQPHIPPPAYSHVEPFGKSIADRARAFNHVRIEPFRYSDSAESIAAMVTVSTQMDPQLEGPFLGYLPQHTYGDLDPKLKMIAKDPANVSLAQLVTNAAVINRPTGPGGKISLKEIQELSAHVQPGDAVLLRTGFLDQHHDSFQWPELEPGITTWLGKEKGSLIFGIDSASVEGGAGGHKPIPNHMGTWENGGINLEGLVNLGAIPTPRCYLAALPPRIYGLDAGPSRCLAIFQQDGQRKIVDLSPVVKPSPGPMTPRPPYRKVEPFEDKNQITRRLRVDPFHVDNCLEDLGMFVTFNTHLGAHLEIPCGPGAPDLSAYPLEKLVGDAAIFDVPVGPGQPVTAELLAAAGAKFTRGDIALVRTGYSDWHWGRPDFYDRSPSFSADAVEWLIRQGAKAVASDCAAIDAQSPLANRPPDRRNLRACFEADIPVASNLTNIGQNFTERPFLVLAPLRIHGIFACPIRAVAIEWA